MHCTSLFVILMMLQSWWCSISFYHITCHYRKASGRSKRSTGSPTKQDKSHQIRSNKRNTSPEVENYQRSRRDRSNPRKQERRNSFSPKRGGSSSPRRKRRWDSFDHKDVDYDSVNRRPRKRSNSTSGDDHGVKKTTVDEVKTTTTKRSDRSPTRGWYRSR